MRNTIFGSVLGQGNGGAECPVGEIRYPNGTCAPRICTVGQELDAYGNCIPIQNPDHYGCVRFDGLFDLINPDTGEVLETGVNYTDLPPNTARLHNTGNQCYPCPPGMTPHEDGYGCCEPAEYVQNENGECVRTRVCHHPGPSFDYAETIPDEFSPGVPWEDMIGPDYTPRPPDIVEDTVEGECVVVYGEDEIVPVPDISDIPDLPGEEEGDGPSTPLIAGGVAILAVIGISLWA